MQISFFTPNCHLKKLMICKFTQIRAKYEKNNTCEWFSHTIKAEHKWEKYSHDTKGYVKPLYQRWGPLHNQGEYYGGIGLYATWVILHSLLCWIGWNQNENIIISYCTLLCIIFNENVLLTTRVMIVSRGSALHNMDNSWVFLGVKKCGICYIGGKHVECVELGVKCGTWNF